MPDAPVVPPAPDPGRNRRSWGILTMLASLVVGFCVWYHYAHAELAWAYQGAGENGEPPPPDQPARAVATMWTAVVAVPGIALYLLGVRAGGPGPNLDDWAPPGDTPPTEGPDAPRTSPHDEAPDR